MSLTKNLNALMKERKVSLTALARQAGVPVATLHGWTAGRRVQNLEHLRRVAAVLQVSLFRLCYGKEDPYGVASKVILREIFRGDVRVSIQRIDRE